MTAIPHRQVAVVLLASTLVSFAAAEDPGPPAWLEIEPNAILDPEQSLRIEVGGIPPDGTVLLEVLQDCDEDGFPDRQSRDGCRNPLLNRFSEKANSDRVVNERLRLSELEAGAEDLKDVKLWLRASRPGSEQALYARFGWVENPCSLWTTLVKNFFGGKCNAGLRQALRRHLGPSGLEDLTFDVRLLPVPGQEPKEPSPATAVAGTRGATGVAWLDRKTLIFTAVTAAADRETGTAGSGLYTVSVQTGKRKRLWQPADEWLPAAPLALPDGRIAFARQRLGEYDDGQPAAFLSVWRGDQTSPGVRLGYKVHQLVASDTEGKRILALTLGVEGNRPGFLVIDLEAGAYEHVGYHHALYHAAMRSPGPQGSAIAFEDNRGDLGWDIALFDEAGNWVRNLQKRSLSDLLPMWCHDGSVLAFLGEVAALRESLAQISPHRTDLFFSSFFLHFRYGENSRLQTLLLRWPWNGHRSGYSRELLATYRNERGHFEALGDQLGEAQSWLAEAQALYGLGDNEESLEAYRIARSLFQALADLSRQGATWIGEGEVLIRLGGIEESLMVYRKARQLFNTAGDKLGEGNSWLSEAHVLFRLGDNEVSLAAHRKARVLLQGVGDKLGEGNTWLGEAEVLLLLGESESARAAYRRGRVLFQTVGDQLGEGNTWLGEAQVLFRLGKNEGSLAAYRRARVLFQVVGDQLGEGNTWLGEAQVLLLLGESEGSLAAYRRARLLFQAMGDQLGEGNTWLGEAQVLFRLGESERTLAAYRKARELFQAMGDWLGEGNTWLGEAQVLFRLGESERTLAAYRKARVLFQAMGDWLGEGNTWLGEAGVFLLLGDNDGSLAAYRRARVLFQAMGDQLGEGNTWLGEAEVLFLLGESEGSLAVYRRARVLFQVVGDQLGEGNTWLGMARVLRRIGRNETAADAAASAADLFERVGWIPSRRDALLLEARSCDRSREREKVIRLAVKAIRLHHAWRESGITDLHRTEMDEEISGAYDLLVRILAEHPADLSKALSFAEEARSRVLFDLMVTLAGTEQDRLPLNLVAERRRLEAELAEVEDSIRQATDPNLRRQVQTKRRQLDRELQWNEYKHIAVQGHGLQVATPLDADGIRHLANEVGPIILYYATDVEVIGFLILQNAAEIHVEHIFLPRTQLGRSVRELAWDLSNPAHETRAAQRARVLWDQLIADFVKHLPESGPLVIIPHGPLHELPFEALLDPEGHPLYERWDFSVAPSASVLAFARQRHQPPSNRDTFAPLVSGRGLRPADEVAEIAQFFRKEIALFQPTDATFRNYEVIATRVRQLLIATRGVHLSGSRSRRDTYLEIRPSRGVHDSRLTASEIAAIPLQAELVTLAACDTARGETLPTSDERLDLTRAFLIAGSAAVLATRWKIPEDASTSRFLVDFYRAYRRGGSQGRGLRKDEALTEARRRSRERGDPAQIWAAWVLVGDPR